MLTPVLMTSAWTMKIAIPVWKSRVSPVFDYAGRVLLVDSDSAGEQQGRVEKCLEPLPFQKVGQLRDLGVNVLICGGLSKRLAVRLEALGITVIPWTSGNVDEVLEAYVAGRLPDGRFRMPGCYGSQGRRRQCRGRGRNRWGMEQ